MLDVVTRAPEIPLPVVRPVQFAVAARPYPRRWLGLAAIFAATLMNLLDSTVSNVAAPSIRADLGGSLATLQWIAAGYTLALAVGLLTGGRLGDMFGRKRMLLIGVVGFMVASMLCAVAVTPELLIGARVLQGAFGALMIPQGFGLIRDLFGANVGQAFAAFGPVIGLATILGPVVAGLLIDADLFGTGWRMIFGINLSFGTFALIAGWKALPVTAPTAHGQPLDVRGALLAAAGMLLLVYPLVQGRELGWPTWTLLVLGSALPVLGGFAWYQRHRARAGAVPLIELSVFTKRSYTAGVLFVVVFFGAVVGFSLSVGLFLQLGLRYSPLGASLAMLAWAIGSFIGTAFGSILTSKLGRHIVHIGLTVMAAGLVGLYLVFAVAGSGLTAWTLAGPMLLFGIGMGMIFPPLFGIILSGVEDHEVGTASGLLESFQSLGASLGIAVLGTVFFSGLGVQADVPQFLDAALHVTALTNGLTGVAFGCAFLLPRAPRAPQLQS
jgi:EmrB/QacA subfamily drug resistance transporter